MKKFVIAVIIIILVLIGMFYLYNKNNEPIELEKEEIAEVNILENYTLFEFKESEIKSIDGRYKGVIEQIGGMSYPIEEHYIYFNNGRFESSDIGNNGTYFLNNSKLILNYSDGFIDEVFVEIFNNNLKLVYPKYPKARLYEKI